MTGNHMSASPTAASTRKSGRLGWPLVLLISAAIGGALLLAAAAATSNTASRPQSNSSRTWRPKALGRSRTRAAAPIPINQRRVAVWETAGAVSKSQR